MDTTEAQRPLIVGVGASAGGLEALMQLLEPAELPFGAAIIVIQHLAPDHRSLMVELLSQHTRLTVVPATDQTQIEPDKVYVIQPRTLVRVTPSGRLSVVASERHNMRPIDLLFESLAESCGAACAGVVLSGTGQDGTLGLQALKKAGGLTIVQRPETARFDGMPQAALASGCVDLMLAPDEVLAEVHSNLLQPEAVFGENDATHMRLLGTIFAALRSQTGVDFSHYKLGTIARRVERRMEQRKAADLAAYTKLVQGERDEALALQQELLIGVTAFMRDADAIEALRITAIPRLLESSDDSLRVWVAGCSTGEEAYSIAMLLDDALRSADSRRELKVFATDIDERALDRASLGKFSAESVAAIPAHLSARYLVADGDEYTVVKSLRERLLFSRHNVVVDPPFPRIHLVSCRNLLIYLKPRVQQRVFTSFSNALTADGLLWLGSSETLGARAEDFEVLDQRWKLFRAKPERPRRAMAMAMSTSVRRDLTRPARADLGQEIAQALVSGLLPPTIVVDEGMQLAYRYGNVAALINVPEGKASLDVRELLPHSLAVVVSVAVQRARNTQEDSVFRNLTVQLHDGTSGSFDVRARPLRVRGRVLIAMVLERTNLPLVGHAARDDGNVEIAPEVQMRMNTLERELRESQAHLQSTVEELESSNQELQATNEELVASNEELQSTNEELQSVNEELHTINAEHTQRLDELMQITQDLDQLLSTLDVGIVFLDTDLTIRRFNKRAAAYISVMPQDIGRPLTHLTHTLDYADLLADCIRVIKTGEAHSCTVRWSDGRVKVRVHSFSGPAKQPKGLVITLADENT